MNIKTLVIYVVFSAGVLLGRGTLYPQNTFPHWMYLVANAMLFVSSLWLIIKCSHFLYHPKPVAESESTEVTPVVGNIHTLVYYQIKDRGGICVDKNDKYVFDTAEEAIAVATEFKNDPRSHNQKMTDENVAYWKSQTYIIEKKTVITEQLQKI